jgi:hypothetical protein
MMNKEIAESILKWEDHDELDFFEEVTEEIMGHKSRWSIFYSQVYKDTRDGKFWELQWSRGATEQQDEGPENIQFYQVVPKEVTHIEYVAVEK